MTTIAAQEKLPYLFLDSGALLFKRSSIRPQEQQQKITTARGIARAMQAMNSRAVGIANQDLAGGIELLKEIQEQQQLNWLSMNLVDPESRKPIFTPSVNTKVGETTIGILGITDEQAGQKNNQNPKEYIILPWQETLPSAVAGIGKTTDMVILLSSYPAKVNQEIARTVKGIDLILASGHSPTNKIPYLEGNVLMAKVASQGKYVGMMRINWTESGLWGHNFDDLKRAERNRLDRVNWQIGRLEKRAGGGDLSSDARYTRLLADKEKIRLKIKEIENRKQNAPEIEKACSFSNRFIALKTSMPEDRAIRNIVDKTTQKVNDLNRKKTTIRNQKQHPSMKTVVGWQKCRECHAEQTAFWQTTDHSKALQSLQAINQQFNEDCLLCHVTLPSYDPARVRADNLLQQLPKSLQMVGCESCHGAGAAHAGQPEAIRTVKIDETVCLTCHTPDHDDNFVFSEKIGKVRCPRE